MSNIQEELQNPLANLGQPSLNFGNGAPTISEQLQGLKVNEQPFAKTVNYFQFVSPRSEILSGKETVDILKRTFSITLQPKETLALEAIIDLLPENLRRGTRGEAGQTILSFVNLLPIIRAAETEMAKNVGGADNRALTTYTNRLASIRNKVLDAYKENERQNFYGRIGPDEMQSVTPEEVEKRLENYVASPEYTTPPAQQANIAPVTTSSSTTALDAAESSVGISPFGPATTPSDWTMDAYLRNNPESTIYDLIKMEEGGTPFTDGFENSYFNQLTRGDWITEKDADGKVKQVSAIKALNLIYDLDEKGDKTRISEIQRMLTEAGYFQVLDTTYRLGEADEATVNAWAMFLTESAKRNMVPSNLFADKKKQWAATRKYGAGLTYQDPNTVFALMDQIGMQVLDRTLTESERVALFAKVREWERLTATNQTLSGGMPTSVDIESRMANYISQQNRSELDFGIMQEFSDNLTKWFG